jgi:hypothetical protein
MPQIYRGIVARTVSVWSETAERWEVVDEQPAQEQAVWAGMPTGVLNDGTPVGLSAEALGLDPSIAPICLVEFRTVEGQLVYQTYVTAT